MPETATIRERAINFGEWEVRALLAGRKTQVRRVAKLPTVGTNHIGPIREVVPSLLSKSGELWDVRYDGDNPRVVHCSFGVIRDRIWVRESWSPDHASYYPNFPVVYRADNYPADWEIEKGKVYSGEAKDWYPFRWRPSIHMPRHLCRIVLEITEIRVERLRDISDADAISEGVRRFDDIPIGTPCRNPADDPRWSMEQPRTTDDCLATPRLAYGNYWNKLHRDKSGYWPDLWVWVISFKRLEASR